MEENKHIVEEDKKPRLLRKFYSKLFMCFATAGICIYSLIKIDTNVAYFLSFLNSGVLFVYFLEGVGRVRKRLNGKWL
jgi:hypothetical protein